MGYVINYKKNINLFLKKNSIQEIFYNQSYKSYCLKDKENKNIRINLQFDEQ